MMMKTVLIEALTPAALELAGIVAAGVIAWAAAGARKAFGVKVEEAHRQALHSAIMTGLKAAISKGQAASAADIAAQYAKQSVPDAVKALGASTDVLRTLALSKLNEASRR